MYSDTHCHFDRMNERGVDFASLILGLAKANFRFVMDIGTRPGDLGKRLKIIRAGAEAAAAQNGGQAAGAFAPDSAGLPPFLHLSCALWPDPKTIAARGECLKLLEKDIAAAIALAKERAAAGNGEGGVARPVIVALGECGIDRYWNGDAAVERIAQKKAEQGGGDVALDDSTGTPDTAGEEELFAAQIALAQKHGLPFIVHSRDAFDVSFSIIKSCGYFRGVIHCFSYGIKEAEKFLDLGFYLSFPGNITFSKKADVRERTAKLLSYVPRDRFLLETDAPYLTPVPERGTVNTPLKVEYVYKAAAAFLGTSEEALCNLVYANALEAFSLQGQG